jgi:hypothetical protein
MADEAIVATQTVPAQSAADAGMEAFLKMSAGVIPMQKAPDVSQGVLAQPAIGTQIQQNQLEPKPDEKELYANNRLKETFGFENWDTAKTEWEKIKAQPTPKEEIQFENDFSRQVFDYIKAGKQDDIRNFLQREAEIDRVTSLDTTNLNNAESIIKANLKLEHPNYSDEDITDVYNEQYKISTKPTQGTIEADQDYNDRVALWEQNKKAVDRKLRREATEIKDKIAANRQKLNLPEIEYVDPEIETQKLKDEQEKKSLVDLFKKTVTEDFKTFNGFSTTFVKDNTEVPVNYTVTEQEKTAYRDKIADFDINAYFGERWFDKDGKPNVQLMMDDIYLLDNKAKVFGKFANESANQAVVKQILQQSNVQLRNGSTQSNIPLNNSEAERDAHLKAFLEKSVGMRR